MSDAVIEKKEQDVFVVGHTNPDTDSICAAIAYANLKKKVTGKSYLPKRAGTLSPETEFVLKHFNVKTPGYLSDVREQVKDMEIRQVPTLNRAMSLKAAWDVMDNETLSTLPIVDDEHKLVGLISVADIAKSYMDVYDCEIISKAKTTYKNLLEVLEGTMIVGDENGCVEQGKVLIGAANPEMMENYVDEGDIVIVGDRYESQLCAIEMHAKLVVVCTGANVAKTITRMAEHRGCAIIQTKYDTFVASRLLNQSMPIDYFMRKDGFVTFNMEDFIDDIKVVMAEKRHRDFPIIDKNGKYVGMISRRNLLNVKKKDIVLVDHNEVSQSVDGLMDANILEIIDHHKIGSLETMAPVYFRNQPVGCTNTIIYQMYRENGVEIEPAIAGLMCSAILSDTLVFRSPTCTPVDVETAEALAKIAGIDIQAYAKEMFAAGSDLSGKAPEEIFYQDFKKFTAGNTTFGVGQITAMDSESLLKLKERMTPYIESTFAEHGADMLFFMLTDILEESTDLMIFGEGAEEAAKAAFHSEEEDRMYLKGCVSRKKQIVPQLMKVLD
ncbi:MAG: putative manganese-dependent inorganic diphosphatase [Lachnospiraceae bacterium]|nr:putative manganese-dependent inorganic diphosphatase [Lachnospiraceae bacterium]